MPHFPFLSFPGENKKFKLTESKKGAEFFVAIIFFPDKKMWEFSGKNPFRDQRCWILPSIFSPFPLWMFPKIVGETPPNHPFVHRVFPYFHHPFWGTPIFGNTLMDLIAIGCRWNLGGPHPCRESSWHVHRLGHSDSHGHHLSPVNSTNPIGIHGIYGIFTDSLNLP